MSWLYSVLFASLMLASDGNVQKSNNYTVVPEEISTTIKADETERFEQTYPLNANGRVSVSNVNGSVTVETWDKSEVKLQWVKTGESKEDLAEVEVKIDARQDAFRVETDYGDWKQRSSGGGNRGYRNLQVEYRLTVPRTAILDEIETVNGSVSITNAANVTKASAVNGEVKAINLRGTASLSTVNGTVIADFDQMQSGSRISLETVNGTVNLTLPSDVNATVKAETVNGKISNGFNLPVRKGQYVGRDMYGKLGSGDVQIKLESVNGELFVNRKNDGKNLSPATNLLTPKNKDNDEDWDEDGGFSAMRPPTPPTPTAPRTPRTPRTPPAPSAEPRAVPEPPAAPNYEGDLDAETLKEVQDALKLAQEELDKLTPEMKKQMEAQIKAELNSKAVQDQLRIAQKDYQRAMGQMRAVNWNFNPAVIEEKSDSFTVKGTPKVTVDAGDCAVTVRGWDKSEVKYTLTSVSRRQTKTPLDFKAEQDGSDVRIRIGDQNISGQNAYFDRVNRMRLEVFVPKKSNLKITTGGEIRLEGVSGKIDLKGEDEAVNVRDGDGQLSVISENARIRVIGFKGEVDAKNEDGTMNFEGDFQNLSAQTVDGKIVLTLPENANANIESNLRETVGEGFTPNYTEKAKDVFVWKLGKGGSNHKLYAAADGEIVVRNANFLK